MTNNDFISSHRCWSCVQHFTRSENELTYIYRNFTENFENWEHKLLGNKAKTIYPRFSLLAPLSFISLANFSLVGNKDGNKRVKVMIVCARKWWQCFESGEFALDLSPWILLTAASYNSGWLPILYTRLCILSCWKFYRHCCFRTQLAMR